MYLTKLELNMTSDEDTRSRVPFQLSHTALVVTPVKQWQCWKLIQERMLHVMQCLYWWQMYLKLCMGNSREYISRHSIYFGAWEVENGTHWQKRDKWETEGGTGTREGTGRARWRIGKERDGRGRIRGRMGEKGKEGEVNEGAGRVGKWLGWKERGRERGKEFIQWLSEFKLTLTLILTVNSSRNNPKCSTTTWQL